MLIAEAIRIPTNDPVMRLNANGASLWEMPASNFGTRANAHKTARTPATILMIFI
jgi:hypothetical protein